MEQNKKARLKDIAERLDISINAVSLALNNKAGIGDETRMRIIKVADELGYFEQYRNMNRKKLYNNFCVMLEERVFKDTRFYPKVIVGIEKEARKNNFDTMLSIIDEEKFRVPQSIEQGKAAGVLVIGPIDDGNLSMLKSFAAPIVLVDYASYAVNTCAVLTQNIPGAFQATKHLIENGHKKIGFFGEKSMSMSFYERYEGFKLAMGRHGLPVVPEYCYFNNIEENSLINNYMGIVELLKDKKEFPTAWFCANDSAAAVLISALDYLGKKVPDDISVVGFDDVDLSRAISPQLTTIRVDMPAMGALAVQELLRRVDGAAEACRQIRMAVNLISRESVRKI